MWNSVFISMWTRQYKDPVGCRQSIILENSLYPVLLLVASTDRVRFLQDNIREIAKSYLKMAIRASDQHPNVTLCTYVHAAKKEDFVKEMLVW